MVSGNRNRISGVVSGAALVLLLSGQGLVLGQTQPGADSGGQPASPPKRTIEVYRGGVRTDGNGKRLVTPAEIRRAEVRARQARLQAEQQLQQLAEQSSELAEQSFDSFSRGLMPLPDHLEQLQLTQRAELLTARNDEQAAEIQLRHIDRMDAIVSALRDFNQPNAEGWQADLLLAQTLAAEARSQLATMQKREGAAEAAREQAIDLAEAHLERRQADSTIGWATVPMLVNARLVVQQIRQDEPYTLLPAEEFLDDAVTLTRSWQARDAGIGRADRVSLAEYQQARFALRHGLELDTPQIALLYQSAEAAAMQLYDQQREFFQTGSASLYDVARAWNFRNELGEILSVANLAPPESSEQQLRLDFDALQQFARTVTDRRGRIEADLSYIDVQGTRQGALRALDELDAAEKAVRELKGEETEPAQKTDAAKPAAGSTAPPTGDPPATAPRKPVR